MQEAFLIDNEDFKAPPALFKKYLLLSFVLFALLGGGCGPQVEKADSKGKNIICFGDSITKGAGSTEGNDYPSQLSKKLNLDVINAGVNGQTTTDALKRIEADVLQHHPRLVIVEFSANDFFQGLPKQQTFDNLDKMVMMIQEKHAMVVLLEIALGHFGDEYLAGFRKIAKKRRVLLISNVLEGIITNPSLKSDDLHPNDDGYRLIAERIYKHIKPLLENR